MARWVAGVAAGIALLAFATEVAVADKPRRECHSRTFVDKYCNTHYDVEIAGIELGDRASRVRSVLGPPQRRRRGRSDTCPMGVDERRASPVVQTYSDGLTVKLERLSHNTKDVCSTRRVSRRRTVSEIATTSPRDTFANGIRVGSRLRAARRAFRRHGISCTYGRSYQPPNTGECSIPAQAPRWVRRDRVIAVLHLELRHRQIVKIRVRLYKGYS